MPTEIAQQFIDAMHTLERDGDPYPLAELFSEDCRLSNMASERVFRGTYEALVFWREYRGAYTEIESEFRNVVSSGNRIAIRWVTRGLNLRGTPVVHDGAGLIEVRDGKISRLDAWFDAAVIQEHEMVPTPY